MHRLKDLKHLSLWKVLAIIIIITYLILGILIFFPARLKTKAQKDDDDPGRDWTGSRE